MVIVPDIIATKRRIRANLHNNSRHCTATAAEDDPKEMCPGRHEPIEQDASFIEE